MVELHVQYTPTPYHSIYIYSIFLGLSPLPVTVANFRFIRDSLLKMFHNPGGDCYWEGGQPNIFLDITSFSFCWPNS